MEIILKYFDDFSDTQLRQMGSLSALYTEWNAKINVISRKDIDSLHLKHVLHSLAIATQFSFRPGQRVLDIGTGGGFPGIPLAIFFPETQFILADSIRKKLQVVQAIVDALDLTNVQTHWGRVEELPRHNTFDMAVSRAVAPLSELWHWAKPLLRKTNRGDNPPGLICLKGGDLHQEISESGCRPQVWDIHKLFPEPAFEEKYMLYVAK